MKANSTKRKIFDAVDLLTEDTSSQMPVKTMKGGVTMLDIDSIKPFHNHPFHLYEGDRLDDMVESIRDHGILNPVIVREIDDGYEMLSGHNRQKAAKIAVSTGTVRLSLNYMNTEQEIDTVLDILRNVGE